MHWTTTTPTSDRTNCNRSLFLNCYISSWIYMHIKWIKWMNWTCNTYMCVFDFLFLLYKFGQNVMKILPKSMPAFMPTTHMRFFLIPFASQIDRLWCTVTDIEWIYLNALLMNRICRHIFWMELRVEIEIGVKKQRRRERERETHPALHLQTNIFSLANEKEKCQFIQLYDLFHLNCS